MGTQLVASVTRSSMDVPRNVLGCYFAESTPVSKPFVYELDCDRADARATLAGLVTWEVTSTPPA